MFGKKQEQKLKNSLVVIYDQDAGGPTGIGLLLRVSHLAFSCPLYTALRILARIGGSDKLGKDLVSIRLIRSHDGRHFDGTVFTPKLSNQSCSF